MSHEIWGVIVFLAIILVLSIANWFDSDKEDEPKGEDPDIVRMAVVQLIELRAERRVVRQDLNDLIHFIEEHTNMNERWVALDDNETDVVIQSLARIAERLR